MFSLPTISKERLTMGIGVVFFVIVGSLVAKAYTDNKDIKYTEGITIRKSII
jgi:predicted nucleotidyltransferase